MSSQIIKEHYQERDKPGGESDYWSIRNPVVLHIAQEREAVFLDLIQRSGIDIESARVLDFGCGAGGEMLSLLRYGFRRENLFGVDLSFERVKSAESTLDFKVINGDGMALPFVDEYFDIVMQNVVFSSVVSHEMRGSMASEMQRVLKQTGSIIWYDAFRCRGSSPHFLPVTRSEINELFPGYDFRWQSLTTDMGLLKLVNGLMGSWSMLCLDASRVFRTHILGIGSKDDT